MKKLLTLFVLLLTCMMVKASDSDFTNMEPLKLTTPELKMELTLNTTNNYRPELELPMLSESTSRMVGLDFRWKHTNDGVKPF